MVDFVPIYMSGVLNLGITHPSILDALVEFYKTEMFRQNVHMHKTLYSNEIQMRKMQQDIDFLNETCMLYSHLLRHNV